MQLKFFCPKRLVLGLLVKCSENNQGFFLVEMGNFYTEALAGLREVWVWLWWMPWWNPGTWTCDSTWLNVLEVWKRNALKAFRFSLNTYVLLLLPQRRQSALESKGGKIRGCYSWTDRSFPASAACLHQHAWEWAEHPLRVVVQHILPEIRSGAQTKITLGDLLLLWSAPYGTLQSRAGVELSLGILCFFFFLGYDLSPLQSSPPNRTAEGRSPCNRRVKM